MKKRYKIVCLFFCFLVFIGCKKKHDTPEPFRASFQAVINNVYTTAAESSDCYWGSSAGRSVNINGTASSLFRFELSLCRYYKQDTIYHNSIFVDFINHIPNDSLDETTGYPDLFESTFRHLLSTGNFSYTFDSYLKSGIIVSWYDDKGLDWVSGRIHEENNGYPLFPPDYTNSNFSIIYSLPAVPTNGFFTWSQEIHLKFSCWVYNYYGDSIRIENASLNGIYSYKK
jgi:hypothetical protein